MKLIRFKQSTPQNQQILYNVHLKVWGPSTLIINKLCMEGIQSHCKGCTFRSKLTSISLNKSCKTARDPVWIHMYHSCEALPYRWAHISSYNPLPPTFGNTCTGPYHIAYSPWKQVINYLHAHMYMLDKEILAQMSIPIYTNLPAHSPHGTSHQHRCSPPGHPSARVGWYPSTVPAPSSAQTRTERQEAQSCCTAVGQSLSPAVLVEVHPLGDAGNAAVWLQCWACATAGGER